MIKEAIYDPQNLWQEFQNNCKLSDLQLKQFQLYYKLLIAYNLDHNLTTVTDLKAVIHNHYEDSLQLSKLLDVNKLAGICDVGTGGGFPGLPLKIVYPHLNVILIEVIHKKIEFLQRVIDALGLTNIEINSLDWRTFLRKTDYRIDVFCARASLHPQELLRLFKPSCKYRNLQFVYWASKTWQPEINEIPFISKIIEYTVGNKDRKLVLFKNLDQL